MIALPRKLAIAAAVLALCLCVLPAAALADGGGLLSNGGFEDHDGTVPTDWISDCWDREEGFSLFTTDLTGGPDGNVAACVENAEPNDARYMQAVSVKKGKLYRLSGDIRVEGAQGSWGATLSFENTYTHTEPLLDTGGEWKPVEVYARAGRDQSETTVFIRLGGYGSLTRGKAWFDNVRLEEVDSLPEGMGEGSMATFVPSNGDKGKEGGNHLTEIIVIAMLFGAVLLYAFKHIRDSGDLFSGTLNYWLYIAGVLITGNLLALLQYINQEYAWPVHVLCAAGVGLAPALILLVIKRRLDEVNRRWIDIAYVGYIALAVRIVFALTVRGYPNDIDCWLGWAGQASADLFGMYRTGGFIDYPPGYMYVLLFVGIINRLVPVEQFQILMVKMPAILADIATAYFIYRIATSRAGSRQAAILSLLYLFNPLVIMNSAAWGQIDSILALIVVACFWQAYRNNMWKAALIYGVGLLVKPQMLLFGPVMLAALVVACRNAGSFKNGVMLCLKTVGAAIAGFVVPALPFWIVQGDPMWLPNLYMNASGTYESASVNACNLLALLGGNWVADTQKVFGIPYAAIGYVGMAATCLFVMYWMIFRERTNRRIFLWSAALISGIFVLGLRMHERYMFPAVALLLVYYALERDRRALYLAGIFSITQFLNVAMVLADKHMPTDVLRYGDLFAIANPEGAGYWVFLISLAAVAAFGYMAYAAVKGKKPLLNGRGEGPVLAEGSESIPADRPEAEDAPLSAGEEEDPALDEEGEGPTTGGVTAREQRRWNGLERIRGDLLTPPDASRIRLGKKDWLLMLALTAAYAVLSLVYLGTTQVPQTMWTAMRTDDYAVIDFGKTVDVAEIWNYSSLTKGNLTVSTSDDGEQWTESFQIKHKATEADDKDDLGLYNWSIKSAGFTARFVRISVSTPPVRLLELVFKDAGGNIVAPVGVSDAGGSDLSVMSAGNIIDEPDMTPERPSFYNSTYFDEIYHARTGWEFTQGNIAPYENTHPPLGKDLIALGIWIFGMNPFGWRFMGTLIGILMVPAMYLFGMALFKKTRYAFLTAFLFTFDFMHFVQTRIATIDSYGVFFIILAFLFMYLYLNTNLNSQKLGRTLLPLALCGISFGLAAASKWIGLYAGAGLAVVFFYSLYRRWREYDAVRRGDVVLDDETRQRVLHGFSSKIILTLLWCVLFFVVIPGIIYFASYIPFNIGSGGKWNSFKYAWDNQTNMFNYHSRLVDNHFFKSPWYQWPFMIKPMWFYKADHLPQGWMGSIATFGNPAVWWAGLAAMVWLVLRVFRCRRFRLPETFLLFGFLTAFLPWVLVPRTMFIYHYFASVPFFVMAIVMYIREWEQKPFTLDKNAWQQALIVLSAAVVVSIFMSPILVFVFAVFLVVAIVLYRRRETASLYKQDLTGVYLAVVLALFILFYPVLTGMPIPSWYGGWLKWLPTWYFTY